MTFGTLDNGIGGGGGPKPPDCRGGGGGIGPEDGIGGGGGMEFPNGIGGGGGGGGVELENGRGGGGGIVPPDGKGGGEGMIPFAGKGGGGGIELVHGRGGGEGTKSSDDLLEEKGLGTLDGGGGIVSPVERGLEAIGGRVRSVDIDSTNGIGGGGGIEPLDGIGDWELVEHIGGNRSERSLV